MRALNGRWRDLLAAALLIPVAAPMAAADEVPATVVWFQEQETGIDPYPVRYIVTADYLRSDDGVDAGSFLLFDRHTRRISSVVPANRSVLVIDGEGELPEKPTSLEFSVRRRVDEKAPAIDGVTPLELKLVAGDKVCRTALVVPGFLEPVRAAMQEFSRALAVQQQRTLSHTPENMQTPCFLSRYLYAGDFQVAQGMPLADWDDSGERRELTRFDTEVGVDDSLFEVPTDYNVITAGGR